MKSPRPISRNGLTMQSLKVREMTTFPMLFDSVAAVILRQKRWLGWSGLSVGRLKDDREVSQSWRCALPLRLFRGLVVDLNPIGGNDVLTYWYRRRGDQQVQRPPWSYDQVVWVVCRSDPADG